MARTYIQLVNSLRDRMNEPHIPSATWDSVVGFDQYTKDAINYAYHDILNAEMEWPFLHREGSFLTIPGIQFYDVTTADEYTIKEIDWDSFCIDPNFITTTVIEETHLILASNDYIVTPTNSTIWMSDLGVQYSFTGIDFNSVDYDPQATGEYTIKDGLYYFNSGDVNTIIKLNYTTATTSVLNNTSTQFLPYINYDEWRQIRRTIDKNMLTANAFSRPSSVFKTQVQGEVGLTPPPSIICSVKFEYWVDADDLVNSNDTLLLPVRFEQVLLDGAAKYCYEFREDTPLAKSADDRFNRGLARMRIELINRNMDFRSGFQWRQFGWSNQFTG